MVFLGSFGSGPNFLIMPWTWAPMSMFSSASMVPVALMVAKSSPRSAAAVRNRDLLLSRAKRYHQPPNPRTATTTKTTTSLTILITKTPWSIQIETGDSANRD